MQTPVVAILILGAALAAAKPPPVPETGLGPAPGPAPWAAYGAYSSKSGAFKGRSLVGLGAPASAEDESVLGNSLGGPFGSPFGGPFSPMSPFLKLKPFLPAKPTFMPPVVDPSKFIDMKADLLNSLFPGGLPVAPVAGAAPSAYSSVSARALFSPFASGAAPTAAVKPPPPAFLAELFKALNINKTVANASDPAAATYPTLSYPAAALAAPAAPVVDPGMFISKKAKFLSDLFAGLATTTPAPTVSATPDPNSPDSAALNAELAASLQRLLDSLSAAAAPDSTETEDEEGVKGKAKRAADTTALVADAKDKVVATIIGELAELKNGMVTAVSDLAQAQKDADAAAAAVPKKPLSPFAAMWAKPTAASASAKTTATPPAVEPVRQKVVLLSQVFDMLADMEKDISSSMAVPPTAESVATESPASATTPSFMDMVKTKINQMVVQSNASIPSNVTFTSSSGSPKSLRLAGVPPTPAGPPVDPTFWIPDSAIVGPDAYLSKTKEFLANLMAAKSTPSPIARRSYKPYKSSYYQQQDQPAPRPEGQGPAQPAQSQQSQQSQQSKPDAQNIPAAIAYQFQQLRHHHHNRQPYWWN